MPKYVDSKGNEVKVVKQKRAPTAWNKAVKVELDKGLPFKEAIAAAKKKYKKEGAAVKVAPKKRMAKHK